MTVETDRFPSYQRRAVPSNQPQSDIKLEKQLLLHPNEALPTDPDQLDRASHYYSHWRRTAASQLMQEAKGMSCKGEVSCLTQKRGILLPPEQAAGLGNQDPVYSSHKLLFALRNSFSAFALGISLYSYVSEIFI